MKITLCVIACLIGFAAANTCSDSQPCSTSITTCGHGFTLTCRTMHCVCVQDGGNAHTCSSPMECHDQNLHHCHLGTHWLCDNGHCHCGHSGPGGPGGN